MTMRLFKCAKAMVTASVLCVLILGYAENIPASVQVGGQTYDGPAQAIAAAWNKNTIKSLAPLLADGMILHGPIPDGPAGFAGNGNGKAAFLIHLGQLRGLLGKDAKVVLRNVLKDGNLVAATYEFSGVHAGFYLGVGPSGQPLTLIVQDTYLLRDGKIVETWHGPDRFSLIDTMSLMPKNIPSYKRISAETVAAFKPGSFPESVVEHPNGDFFVTLQTDGQIWRISNGEASLFVQLPKAALVGFLPGPSTLNIDSKGRVVAVVHSANPEFQGVWAYDEKNAKPQKLAALPVLHNHVNGSAIDDEGRIYVADSTLGAIWQVVEGDPQGRIWMRDPLLAPRQFVGLAPGANGIRYLDGMLYVAVSDKHTIVKIPVGKDGRPGGIATVHAKGVNGDDFGIDKDGTLYVTTHIENSVVQIAPDGKVLGTIATEQDGIIGPTAAIVSRDGKWLYVTNDGGFLGPPRPVLKPNLSRLRLK